jgi:sarcosine oxidase, subunit delta
VILIPCPWCGPRDAGEFHSSGETKPRPDAPTTRPEQWRDYLYFPDNPRGEVTETWYHRMGCRQFFVLQRDTDSNESIPPGRPR